MLSRRSFALTLAAAVAAPHIVRAQGFPASPIRLIVPFAAGGGTDAIGRILAEEMQRSLGQPVIVENRPGAGSNIGIKSVATSSADGYTVLLSSIGIAINGFLYRNPGYNVEEDFSPLSLVGMVPNLMAVPSTSPAKTVREFVDYAKSQPGKLTYASAGKGSSLHLCAELFKRVAGVDMVHVAYRGSAPALQDLMAGRVDCIFDVFTAIYPQVESNTVRGLALTSARRIAASGSLPTMAESGLPDFDFSTWFGLFVPAKTSGEISTLISKSAQQAARAPEVRRKLEGIGVDLVGSGPDELRAHVQKEITRWGPIIRDAGISPD